jgi:hypothetical protein
MTLHRANTVRQMMLAAIATLTLIVAAAPAVAGEDYPLYAAPASGGRAAQPVGPRTSSAGGVYLVDRPQGSIERIDPLTARAPNQTMPSRRGGIGAPTIRGFGSNGLPTYDSSGLVMYGARSRPSGIPQPLPGSRMNRGAMRPPTIRGIGRRR